MQTINAQIEMIFVFESEEKPGCLRNSKFFPYIFGFKGMLFKFWGSDKYILKASKEAQKAFCIYSLHSIFRVIPKKGHGISIHDINY